MIVVDASIAVKWFIEEPGRDAAMRILRSNDVLIAPDLILIEVMNVLRRGHRRQLISEKQLDEAAGVILRYFDRLISARELVRLSVTLSRTLNHSVYDCVYLACAIIEDSRLATADLVFGKKSSNPVTLIEFLFPIVSEHADPLIRTCSARQVTAWSN